LPIFEQALFQPFKFILQQDIDRMLYSFVLFKLKITIVRTEYVPYIFQVLAQMLDLQNNGQVPNDYRSILTLLLTPASWQQKGSIPGLVRLLKTFLARDSAQMIAAGQVGSVLAVVQQRLIPSKLNDAWGFELLQSVFLNVDTWVLIAVWSLNIPYWFRGLDSRANLQQYLKPIFLMLLTRMQANKTDKFVYLFARFILYTMAINKEGFTPDQIIGAIEEIQSGFVML
jgi:exportin-2 (importin alpha re-exporter)